MFLGQEFSVANLAGHFGTWENLWREQIYCAVHMQDHRSALKEYLNGRDYSFLVGSGEM